MCLCIYFALFSLLCFSFSFALRAPLLRIAVCRLRAWWWCRTICGQKISSAAPLATVSRAILERYVHSLSMSRVCDADSRWTRMGLGTVQYYNMHKLYGTVNRPLICLSTLLSSAFSCFIFFYPFLLLSRWLFVGLSSVCRLESFSQRSFPVTPCAPSVRDPALAGMR